MTRKQQRRISMLCVLVAFTSPMAGCTSEGEGSRTLRTPSYVESLAPPAWTEKCLPQNAAYRLGPAPEFVGLTFAEAIGLARTSRVELVYVGGGGRCGAMADGAILTARPPLVAIAIDMAIDRDVTDLSQISSDAKVVLAEHIDARALDNP